MTRSLALALVGLALGGCFRATVRSGAPPGSAPGDYDPKWHNGFVGGIIEGSGPHALDELCPEGWAEVETRTNPFESLLHIVTWTIYAPQDVTIVCAGPAPGEGKPRSVPEPEL